MARTLPFDVEINLGPDDIWCLEAGTTVCIEALSGALWISQPAEPRDIVVMAGQKQLLQVAGQTLISALKPQSQARVSEVGSLRHAA